MASTINAVPSRSEICQRESSSIHARTIITRKAIDSDRAKVPETHNARKPQNAAAYESIRNNFSVLI